MYQAPESGTLNIPQPSQLVVSEGNKISYFFGDGAFPLDRHLMRPYSRSLKFSLPQEIFSYRLCRVRMTVEGALERLLNRFRIFHRAFVVLWKTMDAILKACCLLHNYLTAMRAVGRVTQSEENLIVEALSAIGHRNHKTYKHACRTRNELSR